nr:hypothetical protein [Tanacetum cinerariifolium]
MDQCISLLEKLSKDLEPIISQIDSSGICNSLGIIFYTSQRTFVEFIKNGSCIIYGHVLSIIAVAEWNPITIKM